MRDLLKAGPNIVASIRQRGKPDLVCHYHFLGAVGKKLFDTPYSTLQGTLKNSKVRSDSWALLRDLRRYRKSEIKRRIRLLLEQEAQYIDVAFPGEVGLRP